MLEIKISPKELACLVSKLNVDTAAGTEVFSHYSYFSAPRLWTSSRRQACDSWSLKKQNKKTTDAERETLGQTVRVI